MCVFEVKLVITACVKFRSVKFPINSTINLKTFRYDGHEQNHIMKNFGLEQRIYKN